MAEPISRWLLNDLSGSIAVDSVGPNNGTYISAELGKPSIIPALPAEHAALLGEGAYITVADDESLHFKSGLTISLWYEALDSGVLLAREFNYELWLEPSGALGFSFRDPAGEWHEVESPEGAIEGGKHAIHVTYDLADLRIFVDGVVVAEAPFTQELRGSEGEIWVGVQPGGEFRFCHGRYQRISLYDSALSPAEVLAEYEEDAAAVWMDFVGDYEPGDFSQYFETQAPEGRARVVTSPVAEGNFAGLFEVLEGDPEVAGGHRAETIPDRLFFDGDEIYIRELINLLEVDWDHWSIPIQLHDTSKGSPPLCGLLIKVEGQKRLRICSGDQKNIYFDLAVPERRYFELVLHVVFGVEGSVEVWLNGVYKGKATEANTIGNEPVNLKVGVYRSAESVGRTAIAHDGLRITTEFFSNPPATGNGQAVPRVRGMYLDWELCDLNQTVLTRLDGRRGGGRVELGLNAGRRAFCPLSMNDPALALADAIETVLRVTLRGPDSFSLPLFIGRVAIPERGSEAGKRELGLHALDPLFSLDRKLARVVKGSVWEAVTFADKDQSQILWELIDAHEGHGIAEGDLPASVSRDRTYPPGKEVGQALVEMSEVISGPDFELEPVVASDGTLCRFNTHHPRQGADLSEGVVFVHGRTPHTAVGFRFSPGGEEIANRVLAIGAPREQEGESPFAEHPAYLAEHDDSIDLYGEAFEKRLNFDDVVETATLESHAKAAVSAAAFPVPYFDFTAAPEYAGVDGEGVPPVFGVDYWLGDTIAVEEYASSTDDPLHLEGRVTDAVVTERESGQIAVKVTCAPEVSSEGVTGEAVTLRVPEGEE